MALPYDDAGGKGKWTDGWIGTCNAQMQCVCLFLKYFEDNE